MDFDLQAALPDLLPGAIAWAELKSREAAEKGQFLSVHDQEVARNVGVQRPEAVRVLLVDQLPIPEDFSLRSAAIHTGLLGPQMVGLTLGHSILIVRGAMNRRLLSHECRHVHQYEQFGSIGAFLAVYLQQIVTVGYDNAPLEQDARAYEQ